MKNLCLKVCEQNLEFRENGDIVMFTAYYSTRNKQNQVDGIITNVVHVTKIPTSPILKHLAEELNEAYDAIRNIRDHLEEIS